MKYLFLFLFFFIDGVIFAQNHLYLIYTPNTLPENVDIRKHLRMKGEQTPVWRMCYMNTDGQQNYVVHYPIFGAKSLWLEKKEGTNIVNLGTIAQANALYPQAKTLQQLLQEVQPAIDADFQAGELLTPQQRATFQYFYQYKKMYVIEYLQNGNAILVDVSQWWCH